MARQLRAAQNKTNLRAVAVRQYQIPACFDHVGDVLNAFHHRFVLVGNAVVVIVLDQRIAAYGDYC